MTVELEVDGASPEMGSPYGGFPITITGRGFSCDDPTVYDITVGGAVCSVNADAPCSETELSCFLDDTSTVHRIRNTGFDSGEKNIINTRCSNTCNPIGTSVWM